MSGKSSFSDVSALLYALPFVVPGVYGIYLWTIQGLSMGFTSSVYLSVTRDPYVFLVGSLGVLLAAVLDVKSTEPAARNSRTTSASRILLGIGASTFVLAVLFAFLANGFGLSETISDMVVGKYSLIFPSVMVLAGYLTYAPLKLGSLRNMRNLGIICMFVVPLAVYALGRRSLAGGLGVGLVFLALGAVLLRQSTKARPEKQPQKR
jgi:hypothetical protein